VETKGAKVEAQKVEAQKVEAQKVEAQKVARFDAPGRRCAGVPADL
jgi:hypothetical protein